MASAVEFEPVPAMIGRRPRAASMTTSTTRLCSSWLSVGDSPVVPQGTMASVPCATWKSTSSRSFASSTLPFRNGVTRATIEPWNVGRVMALSSIWSETFELSPAPRRNLTRDRAHRIATAPKVN